MEEKVVELKSENTFLKEKVNNYEEELKRLKHIINLFKKEKFSTKSETYLEEDPQLLFNEIEQESLSEPQLPLVQEQITYTRNKGRQSKKSFPEHLEREKVIIPIADEDKFCPYHGVALKEIGEDRVEKLITVPAKSKIRVEIRKKYASVCCDSHMAQAKANSIIPKTIATPEILSYLIFSKYFQGLPLYRLEELYKLQGIQLSRGTMALWLINVSEQLVPIWNLLEEKMQNSGYMAIDATSVKVLKEKDRPAQTKSSMWVRGSPEKGIVLFDYNISGGGKVAKELIGDFKGAVQSDAHKGYGTLDTTELKLLGCMMHARRRFYKAWIEANKKQGLADVGLKMIKRLYKFEEAYKQAALNAEQRHSARQKEVKPYIEKIKKWCEKNKTKVLKSSPIGNAINYFINEYEELAGFLDNGRYEIDNGWVERVIRKFAIGRNNWMFSDRVEGANASSILYSLALTAKLNDKDPYEAFVKVFEKLPSCLEIDDYEELTKLFLKSNGV